MIQSIIFSAIELYLDNFGVYEIAEILNICPDIAADIIKGFNSNNQCIYAESKLNKLNDNQL